MNALPTWMLAAAAAFAGTVEATAQLQVVASPEPQLVFAGPARKLSLIVSNAGNQTIVVALRARLVQTTSATAVTIGEQDCKKISVLPSQAVLESAAVDFPPVKAETRFLVQWLNVPNETRSSGRESAPSDSPANQGRLSSAATTTIVGTTEVLVYPTNLLAEMKALAGEDQAVGVFDPGNVLKPLLKTVRVEVEDLEESGIASFRDKLAIIGPFNTREQMLRDLSERVEKLARKGAGIVWLQPPPASRAKLQPSFQTVPLGAGAVVIVQAQLVADLANSPQAQLNLLHFCRLAREPELATVSPLTNQPR